MSHLAMVASCAACQHARMDPGLAAWIDERFDGLSEDMRQRFRVVNGRLALLA